MCVAAISSGLTIDEKELAVADWALRNRRPAGNGTETLSSAKLLYLPLLTTGHAFGALGISLQGASEYFSPHHRHLLDAFVATAWQEGLSLADHALLVALNPGQLILNGFSVLEAVEAVGSAVAHVYASDAESDRPRRLGRFVPLGEGSADFPALLGALEERAYRGHFTLTTADESDPIGAMKRAMDFLKQL